MNVIRCMVVALVLVLTGCTKDYVDRTTVPVETRVPVLDVPARPKLASLTPEEVTSYAALPAALREKLQANDRALKEYAAEYEVTVKAYNVYATLQNQRSNKWMGIPEPVQPVKIDGK